MAQQAQDPLPAPDPLTVKVDATDAQRFASLWRKTNGQPTAEQLQQQYLNVAGRGIEVFTPGRIGSAERLAGKIAANRQIYADAVERCLPWVEGTNAQLRSTYLGFKGLLPVHPLPQISVVFGANNSGGTAAPGIQVIGLEVICRLSPTRADFEERMRQFFAHETVHTWQTEPQDSVAKGLLGAALQEGVPDYITHLVTGRVSNASRDDWARTREAWVWREFQRDDATIRAGTDAKGEMTKEAQAAFRRWFGNAGNAPEGWPDELGYWVGMRIAEHYVAASACPRAAIDQLLNPRDPAAVLRKSGYGTKLAR